MSYACQYETSETFNFYFVQKAPQVALSQHSSCQKMRAIYYKSGESLLVCIVYTGVKAIHMNDWDVRDITNTQIFHKDVQ